MYPWKTDALAVKHLIKFSLQGWLNEYTKTDRQTEDITSIGHKFKQMYVDDGLGKVSSRYDINFILN